MQRPSKKGAKRAGEKKGYPRIRTTEQKYTNPVEGNPPQDRYSLGPLFLSFASPEKTFELGHRGDTPPPDHIDMFSSYKNLNYNLKTLMTLISGVAFYRRFYSECLIHQSTTAPYAPATTSEHYRFYLLALSSLLYPYIF